MDRVIRQENIQFNLLLNKIRIGEIDDDSVNFILSRNLHDMNRMERKQFSQQVLNIMPILVMTHNINLQIPSINYWSKCNHKATLYQFFLWC